MVDSRARGSVSGGSCLIRTSDRSSIVFAKSLGTRYRDGFGGIELVAVLVGLILVFESTAEG